MTKNKPRIFKGFGVVTRQGHYLPGYFRPSLDDTKTDYYKHNPQIEGHENGHTFVKVTQKIETIE